MNAGALSREPGITGIGHQLRDAMKRELARVTEERDILKKATAYFVRESR